METSIKRILYLDILRIVAILGVIVLHVNCRSFNQNAYHFYWSLSTYCVPIFFMVSGAIFLNREIGIKTIYSKYIFRIVAAFVFWSFLYAFMRRKGTFIEAFLIGEFHMWFMFVIVGFYMAVPVLRKITENKKILEYFLIISFIVSILIPSLQSLLAPSLVKMLEMLNLNIFSSTFYFLIGYYLHTYTISKRKHILIYMLGLICLLTIIFYKNFAINETVYAISIFLAFKDVVPRIQIKANLVAIIEKIARLTFGVFLVHIMAFRVLLNLIYLPPFNSYILIPVLLITVYLISLFVTYLFSNIPILNKYII